MVLDELAGLDENGIVMLATNIVASPTDEFAHVVRLAPLVSIDLIIRDNEQKVLVALRTNEPAKDVYFVPGGCIWKNETIEAAFKRILKAETGCTAELADAEFLGVFQHFYPTNRFGLSNTGTHYIVLTYEVTFATRPKVVLDSQHSRYQWLTELELKVRNDVHENTKAYFVGQEKRREHNRTLQSS